MHQQYNKPPLFEVTCEMTFIPDESWNVFFYSEFYEKIKERFPHKIATEEYIIPTGIVIGQNQQPILEKRTKLECKNEEGNLLVTFRENFLGVTIVPPYTGWQDFKEIISYVLELYKEVVQPVLIKRIVLKYRNKVNVGTHHSYQSISNFFNTRPNLDQFRTNAN